MWWKLVLLTLYLAALFILSRILEAVAYYEGGYLASHLLDPVSLSVKKLKTLLDQRGVSYAGVVEKQELTELVETSGEVSEGEVESAMLSEETATSTNFTCGTHFYEEVEDTKDSVWVVQVIRDQTDMFLRHDDWKAFIKKVARFGVRTGIFDCSLDWRLCDKKGWYSSRLVLALPQGSRAKDNVVLRTYTGSTRVQAVFDWVNFNLASRIQEIYTYKELQKNWFNFESLNEQGIVRVLLFSRLKIPPMFYSVLSVKFTGRVKFGSIDIRTEEGRQIIKTLGLDKIPTFLILTPEGNFTFGKRIGEHLNYKSMGLFLKCLHPEVNDLFLLSLITVNIMCWFDLFIVSGNLVKRLGAMLWSVGKWNCMLILLWLPILGLFQLPYMDTMLTYALKLLRLAAGMQLACCIRSDWLWVSAINCSFLIVTFLAFATVAGLLHYKYKGEDLDPALHNNNNTDWWNLNWDSYMSYFFRPMSTLTRPMGPPDMDLEVGMELLIERLAVPNFWLRPIIATDYIKDLPTWTYTGVTVESDIGSDCESLKFDSDGDEALSGTESPPGSPTEMLRKPYMFTCEKCRALRNEDGSLKSAQEIEQDRMDHETACAKFLMDGDYKCMCKMHESSHSGRRHHRHNRKSRNSTKDASKGQDEGEGEGEKNKQGDNDETMNQMPPGMLHVTECVICLESYKYGVHLCGLPCGHSFHYRCIMGWLSRDNHCCPVCRWPTYKAKPCFLHLHAE